MAEQAAQFKCDVCGASFRDADSLTKHMAIHNTGKQEKEHLEQGTDKPMQNPSMPGQSPSPSPSPSPGPSLSS